ncbi:T9SS type A sorting domain-containing protein [Hymenobacter jejuensis]|uniref:T9SS type A sorting domain-containing protein n=1 Tax=Hymenobacter jejuensis TaxID=2502781 RepID=A0A5B8A2I1_9BACT|nr:T9SS type A sorting domain-containing protein [Hymenobacter jejuensis]QDA61604.1 T9SS type A sorting domain-containing protein [Hymenobacter jejuensis]
MKTFTRSLVVLLLLVLAGPSAWAETVIIKVTDNAYTPQTVTVHPGDVVKWQYEGGTNSHPTASDNAAWVTFTINTANPTNSITFNNAGSFPYHCTFHGAPGVGMYGVITVAVATPVRPMAVAPSAFRCYPNPADGVVTLTLDNPQARANASVQLINSLGTLVRTLTVGSEAKTEATLTLPVADLPAGLYGCRWLVNGQVVARQRVMLIH